MDSLQGAELHDFSYRAALFLREHDDVFDEARLDIQVNLANVIIGHFLVLHRRVAVEVNVQTGVVIHLQHPCLQILVDQQVQAQDLERFTRDVFLASHGVDLVLDQGPIDLHHFSASVID